MRGKVITSALLTVVLSCSSVYGSEAFDNMSTSEQAQTAGAYIEEIIKDIQNNYYGGNVTTDQLVQAAIKGMTGQLDEYSQYIDIDEYNAIKADSASTHYAPDFKCEFNDNGYPIIKEISRNSVAYKQGLREGDEIREISNISAYGIGVDEYQTLVTKNSSSTVSMQIASTGAIKKMDVKLTRVDNSSVEVVAMSKLSGKNQNYDDKTIGYVKVKEFTENVGSEFQQAVAKLQASGAKKLIIDLRGNTGGYVDAAIAMAKQIVPEGVIISTKDKQGKETVYKSDLKVRPFEKYVILVDNNTASAAEIVASAMQDSGVAKIVGEKTFGKGIMQSVTAYEGLGVLKMTTQEYTTRLGRIINGIGITPDISIDRLKFVSETDTLDSKNVESAVKFLGYKRDKENTVAKDLGMYQLEMGLPVTYVLDKATVSAINLEIYNDMINNDRALTAGYLSLLS